MVMSECINLEDGPNNVKPPSVVDDGLEDVKEESLSVAFSVLEDVLDDDVLEDDLEDDKEDSKEFLDLFRCKFDQSSVKAKMVVGDHRLRSKTT